MARRKKKKEAKKESPQDLDLSLLDDLLKRYAERLEKEIEEKPKLGDFLKMIELRRKIAPGDAEQKKFLKMLESARHPSAPVTKSNGKRSVRKGKAA